MILEHKYHFLAKVEEEKASVSMTLVMATDSIDKVLVVKAKATMSS